MLFSSDRLVKLCWLLLQLYCSSMVGSEFLFTIIEDLMFANALIHISSLKDFMLLYTLNRNTRNPQNKLCK